MKIRYNTLTETYVVFKNGKVNLKKELSKTEKEFVEKAKKVVAGYYYIFSEVK